MMLVPLRVGLQAGAQAAKAGAQAAAKNGIGARLAQAGKDFASSFVPNMAASAPMGALGALYYFPQYYDEQDPVGSSLKALGFIGADVVGSAAVRSALGAGVGAIRPGKNIKELTPAYRQDLERIGVTKPTASLTPEQIKEAQSTRIQQIIKENPTITGPGPYSKEVQAARDQINSIRQTSRSLGSIPDAYKFTDATLPSRLMEPLSTTGDILFSIYGMNGLQELAHQAGIATPNYLKPQQSAQGAMTDVLYSDVTGNPGLVPQSSIVQQQLDNREQAGLPNNAVLAPGTMSQVSATEIDQLMNQLLAQAQNDKDTNEASALLPQLQQEVYA